MREKKNVRFGGTRLPARTAALAGLLVCWTFGASTARSQTLWNNGVQAGGGGTFGITTGTGNGANGQNISVVPSDLIRDNGGGNFTVFVGSSCAIGTPGREIADDFSVPADTAWSVSGATLFAYISNSDRSSYPFPPSSPFSNVIANLWNGVPGQGGSLVGTAAGIASATFTGVYRVRPNSDVSSIRDADRPVFAVQTNFSTPLTLAPGAYWLSWQLAGVSSDGTSANPFSPFVTVAGDTLNGNGLARGTDGTWAQIDPSASLNVSQTSVAFPFLINGTVVPRAVVPEPGTLVLLACGLLFLVGGMPLTRRVLRQDQG